MPAQSFDDALDWLASREGKQVYVEIGMRDPTLPDADFAPLAMHVTLGKFGLGEDTGHDRGLAWLPFSGGDRNRFYLDPARVTYIQIHGALKITFHDALYVAFSGD